MLLFSLLMACKTETPTPVLPSSGPLPGTTLKGQTERQGQPSTQNLPTLSEENAAFSLELLRTVYAADPGNQILSPWSLQMVMAQVYAGAGGDAKTAIANTFGWTLPDADFHEAFDAADLSLTAHHAPQADPPLSITSTNQIFVTTGYPLGQPWLDTLSTWYGTGVQQMDFEADPAGVAADINAWIASQTGDHIKDLINAEIVADSRMLLVNAVYFNASWEVPFSESATQDEDFQLLDGSTVSVPTLSGSISVSGVQGSGFFVADMPYSDPNLSMTLILPDAGQFETVLNGLDWASLSALIATMDHCEECEVQIPKFEVEGKPDMSAALRSLGMESAFGGAYPGISDELTLTAVEQNGFIAISEKGTEAAAATVAEFTDSASQPPFGPIVLDRPFFYLIREHDGGAVLFAGVVTDPR